MSIQQSIYPLVYPSIHPSYPSIYPSTSTPIHQSIHSFNRLSIQPTVYPSNHSSIQASIHPSSTRLSIHLSISPSMHPVKNFALLSVQQQLFIKFKSHIIQLNLVSTIQGLILFFKTRHHLRKYLTSTLPKLVNQLFKSTLLKIKVLNVNIK